MAQWLERYEKHPIHTQITTLDGLISTSEEIVKDVKDANTIESVERLRLVINALQVRFKYVDPLMIPVQVLSNLNQLIQIIINEVKAFNTNRNIAHLTNANNHIDQFLPILANVPSTMPVDSSHVKDSIASLRRSASQFTRNVETEFDRLHKEFNSLTKQMETLASNITAQKTRLDTAITQFQQQFSQAEDRRREQFEQAKDKRREDYEKLVGEIKAEFNNDIRELRNTFQSLIDKTKEDRDRFNSDLKQRSTVLIQEIERQKEKAAELITIITNSGLIGGYQKVANQEQTTSRVWQGMAILSFIGLIAFAVFAFLATLPEQFVWGRVGARAFVAVTFGIFAAYAARQADKHESIERKNRKMELELAAIDPYLSELPVDTRHKIKEELASRLFAQSERPEIITNSKTSGSVSDLLRMALETISNLTKKGGG
jgi:hypothetical protein